MNGFLFGFLSRVLLQCKWNENKRDTPPEVAVSLSTVVTFVTWLISRTEFLVLKVFYNAFHSNSSRAFRGELEAR